MKKLTNILLIFMLFVTTLATAQYGIGTTNPSSSAVLDISSTSKGLLMPRMTSLQRDGIASPATGLLVYNITSNKFNYYNGTAWIEITGSLAPASSAPDAPVIGAATASASSASVAFTAPTNDGGAPITNYIVTSSPGDFTGQGTSSPITVTGLTNGTAYTFTVVAVNSIGTSVASAASNSVTPAAVPSAPTSVVATAGDATASVAFVPGASNGSPITNYTVTSSPGGITASGTSSPIVVSGLTNGTAYTFTVVATSALGNSVASSASAAVTPVPPVPGVITKFAVKPGNASVLVSWEAPSSGGPVASYVLQRITTFGSPSTWTDVITLPSTTLSHNVTGLENGTGGGGSGSWDHRFRVKAVNAGGEAISPELTAIPVVGTVAMHDNFNQVPSSPNWEISSFSHVPSHVFAGSTTPSKLYGTADGRWNVSAAPTGNNATSAQTILTIDRSTGTKEIQFTYYTDPTSSGNGWFSYVGLLGPNGSRWTLKAEYPNSGNFSSTSTSGMTALGAASETNRTIQLGSLSETGNWGQITVRIVLPSAGGLQVYSGPSLITTYTAAQIPASFNNLKFYVNGTSPGQQYIDNVTVINHQ